MAHPVIVVKQEGRRPLYLQVRESIEIGRECDGILLIDGQASRRHIEKSGTLASSSRYVCRPTAGP